MVPTGIRVGEVLEDALDVLTCYFDVLDVHFVFANRVGTDRFEGASSDMKGDKVGGDMPCLQCVEHFGGEMQSCRWGSNRALIAGVDGLVAFVVATDGFAMQIGWKGDDTGLVDNFGKTDLAIPIEVDYPCVANSLLTVGIKGDMLAVDVYFARKGAFFPFLVVADKAGPCALAALLKGLGNGHLVGLKAEDFDGGTCGLLEE